MHAPVQAERLDQALVQRGLAPTRARARDLILRGLVTVDGRVVTKSAAAVPSSAVLGVSAVEAGDVSRGAVKLRAALDAFAFSPAGLVGLDIGASTGGFTQALLAGGAIRVYAVDVGRDQLAPSLRSDPRVVDLPHQDARTLTRDQIPEPVSAIVVDVSFISLTKALDVPLRFAAPGAWLVTLVKPQFEAGRAAIGKGGIVRDATLREAAVEAVTSWMAARPGWQIARVIPSPITGGSGNTEYLLGARYHG